MTAFDKALINVHQQRIQKHKVDKLLAKLSMGTEEEKETSKALLKAIKNPEYNDQTICEALEEVNIQISLSAVRNWRIRNNVKEG